MSRARAQREPRYAVAQHKMTARGRAFVDTVARKIESTPELRGVAWLGSGWRTGSSEHQSGNALDIIYTSDVGKQATARDKIARDALISWLTSNAKALGIRHIICSIDDKNRSMIWRTRKPGWSALPDRGSLTDNHRDHVHVLLEQSAAPAKAIGSQSSTLVKKVQAGLLRVFPAYARPIAKNGGVDGLLGPATRGVLREFQKRSRIPITGVLDDRTLKELQKYGI